MAVTPKKKSQKYAVQANIQDINLNISGCNSSTFFINWSTPTGNGNLQRAVCTNNTVQLGGFSFSEAVTRDTKKYSFRKKTFNIMFNASKIEVDLSQYLEEPSYAIELPIANGMISFSLNIETEAKQIAVHEPLDGVEELEEDINTFEVEITNQLLRIDELAEVLDDLKKEKEQMTLSQVEEGQITLEEYQFIISDIFLSKMTFSDGQHPLTADVIFDKINDGRMIKQEKRKFHQ
ncbi:hypothetical protein QTN25_009333 [Entamoeba marina]